MSKKRHKKKKNNKRKGVQEIRQSKKCQNQSEKNTTILNVDGQEPNINDIGDVKIHSSFNNFKIDLETKVKREDSFKFDIEVNSQNNKKGIKEKIKGYFTHVNLLTSFTGFLFTGLLLAIILSALSYKIPINIKCLDDFRDEVYGKNVTYTIDNKNVKLIYDDGKPTKIEVHHPGTTIIYNNETCKFLYKHHLIFLSLILVLILYLYNLFITFINNKIKYVIHRVYYAVYPEENRTDNINLKS